MIHCVLIAFELDREHTGERPSLAVPRPAADEIRPREASKTTGTPGEVGQIWLNAFGSAYEGTRGEEEERG